MPRHELARLKLMRQPMRSRVAQIVQPCEKSGLGLMLEQRVWSELMFIGLLLWLWLRIPTKSAGDSERSRPPVPIEAGQGFR